MVRRWGVWSGEWSGLVEGGRAFTGPIFVLALASCPSSHAHALGLPSRRGATRDTHAVRHQRAPYTASWPCTPEAQRSAGLAPLCQSRIDTFGCDELRLPEGRPTYRVVRHLCAGLGRGGFSVGTHTQYMLRARVLLCGCWAGAMVYVPFCARANTAQYTQGRVRAGSVAL